jgi:hypothetical protein
MKERGDVRTPFIGALLAALVGVVAFAGVAGAVDSGGFPDVPPWHWASDAVAKDQAAGLVVGYPAAPAELAQNAITQVYEGFAHAGAKGAQAWVERFTYNRPANWPGPLARAEFAQVTLSGIRVAVHDDTATAAFIAAVTTRLGRTVTTPMRVELQHIGGDWQVDYAGLAQGSALFR